MPPTKTPEMPVKVVAVEGPGCVAGRGVELDGEGVGVSEVGARSGDDGCVEAACVVDEKTGETCETGIEDAEEVDDAKVDSGLKERVVSSGNGTKVAVLVLDDDSCADEEVVACPGTSSAGIEATGGGLDAGKVF